MANARNRNDQATVRRWKSLLLVSGLFLAGFGVWQMTLGNVGNGLGMIAVPAVVVSVLLLLINRRGDG
ncbi:MAG TPA: hypothetical protein VK988_04195 [Acidimicrobiales bacterium]|nr:hypothetical protein [Acidimicrobiales bacterium]